MPQTVGDVLTFGVTVRDAAGALANAGLMTLRVTVDTAAGPVDVTGSPFTVNPSLTGTYSQTVTTTTPGRYVGLWTATGANSGARTQVFDVRPTSDPAILSLAAVKAHLNIRSTVTTHDDELQNWVQSVTRLIEHRIGPVVPRTVIERHDGNTMTLWLRQTPVLAIQSIVPWLNHGTTYSVLGLRVDSASGRVDSRSGFGFSGGPFEVTYTAGRIVTPVNVIQAAQIMVKHLWETQRGAASLPLAPGGADDVMVPGFGFAVPNRALELLLPDDDGPGVA